MMNKFKLYYYTLKHLRPSQVFYLIKYKLFPLKKAPLVHQSFSANKLTCDFINWKVKSWKSVNEVKFLNQTVKFDIAQSWEVEADMLWLYNLHYFDDLNSIENDQSTDFHKHLISEWIKFNSNIKSLAWDPYPTSLRLINWAKFFFRYEGEIPQSWLVSFVQQALVLSKRCEYHLCGNHLYANGKALIFSGVLIKDEIGHVFLQNGLEIIDRENNEQFLTDGAHFELSPMYHSILLMDLLELIDLAKNSDVKLLQNRISFWENIASKAAGWMLSMQHTDGGIAFFNDASEGISPPNYIIKNYITSLGILPKMKENFPVFDMADSGFYSVKLRDNGKLIFDACSIGPDHQPGHAHADTLSIELSLFGSKVFVNSGTSMYGTSKEREFQRSTRAHNTVTIDNLNSSQMWRGFRVAKRAQITNRKIHFSEDKIELFAEHNGYQNLGVAGLHSRKIDIFNRRFIIYDYIKELENKEAIFRIHLHPDVKITSYDSKSIELDVKGKKLKVISKFGFINVKDALWYPEFGKKIANKYIEITFSSFKLHTEVSWE